MSSMFSKSFSTTRIALLDVGGEEFVDNTLDDGGEDDFAAGNATSDEIDNTLNTVEDGGNDVDELNGIADNLEDAEADGGASPALIQMAEVAVEHRIMSLTKSKVLPKKRFLPAQENFIGDIRTKQHNTRVAIESIRTMASSAGAKIMEWLRAIGKFFTDMWNSFTNGLEKTKAKLIDLKNKVKSGEITFGGTMRAIPGATMNKLRMGKDFSKAKFNEGLAKVNSWIESVGNWLGSFRKGVKETKPMDMGEMMAAWDAEHNGGGVATESEDGGEGRVQKLRAYLRSKWDGFVAWIRSFGSKKKDVGNGVAAVTNPDVLPGNVTATVTGPISPDANLETAIGATKIELVGGDVDGDGGSIQIESFTNEAEASGFIDKVMALVERVKNFVKGSKETGDAVVQTGNEVKKLSITDRFRSAATKVSSFFRGIGTACSRCYNVVVKYVAGFASAAAGCIAALLLGASVATGAAAVKAGMTSMKAANRAEQLKNK